jgi:hypothetical protein
MYYFGPPTRATHLVISGKMSFSFSNSMSSRATCTINPAIPYTLLTLSKVIAKCLAVCDDENSIVTKLIPLEEVTKNGKANEHYVSH